MCPTVIEESPSPLQQPLLPNPAPPNINILGGAGNSSIVEIEM